MLCLLPERHSFCWISLRSTQCEHHTNPHTQVCIPVSGEEKEKKKNQHEYGLTFHKWGQLSDKTRKDQVKVTGCCNTAADITEKSSLCTLLLLNNQSWGVLVQK